MLYEYIDLTAEMAERYENKKMNLDVVVNNDAMVIIKQQQTRRKAKDAPNNNNSNHGVSGKKRKRSNNNNIDDDNGVKAATAMQPLLAKQAQTIENRKILERVVDSNNTFVISKKDRAKFFFPTKFGSPLERAFVDILSRDDFEHQDLFSFRKHYNSNSSSSNDDHDNDCCHQNAKIESTISEILQIKNNKDLRKNSILFYVLFQGNANTKIKIIKRTPFVDNSAHEINTTKEEEEDTEENYFWVTFHARQKYNDGYLHDPSVTHFLFESTSSSSSSFVFVDRSELYNLIIENLKSNKIITNIFDLRRSCYHLYKTHIASHKIKMLIPKEDLLNLESTVLIQ